MKQKVFGFTLVEILVVISIISVLAGVLYANFGDARAASRDKVRQNTLMEMQVAIELYKSQYGFYPAEGCGTPALNVGDTPSTPGVNWDGDTSWTGRGPHPLVWGNDDDCAVYIEGLVPDFISALPEDPTQEYEDNRGYIYMVSADGSAYKLLSHFTVETEIVTYDHPFSRCPQTYPTGPCGSTPQGTVYGVYSFGAERW